MDKNIGGSQMNKQMKLIAAAVVIFIVALLTAFLVYKYSPSKEVMDLKDYFKVSDDNMAIIMQDHLSKKTGKYCDGIPYLSWNMVKENFNKRFYWDSEANQMLYTTPTDLIKISPDTNEYTVNKSNSNEEYTIIRMFDNEPYIAAPFVKKYSNIEYVSYELPNRIVISYKWGEDVLSAKVEDETSLRFEASIKSPILANLSEGDELVCVDTSEEIKDNFAKVITVDGITGYVKTGNLSKSSYKKMESSFAEPQYTHISKNYDICMVWHQVTNKDANNNLLTFLNETKGVNTISPTWFAIADNDGKIYSLADERYVERAHEAGVEVWGLCDDFSKEIDMSKILGSTETREKLEKKLLSLAIEYNLDGLNIDFENVPADSGDDFIQFVREMSIKCRSNGLVLSINDYVPVEYRQYYDYEEQGIVADYVVIMAYDEHYNGGGEAGSVSSIGFVKKAVEDIVAKVPAERTVMALPFYTRLWDIERAADGTESITSNAYGMNGAENLLKDRGLKASWDGDCAQYYAEYSEEGKTHKIWLEEETSIEEKLKTVTAAGVNNVAFWRLGLERASIWNVVGKYINSSNTP